MKNKKWTINNIPDLSKKIILITGGNSGLGFEAARVFAKKNAQVIFTTRDINKGNEAKNKILKEYPKANIKVMKLDLTDLNSIHNFTKKYKETYNKLDILINNAGIMMTPYKKTKDGFELQFGTNHLGHFALTGLLLDYLKNTPKSRVVNVSSMAHKSGVIDFEDLMFENKKYSPMKSYSRSKLANLLFTYELERRLKKKNIDCISVAAHPGVASTNLDKYLKENFLLKILLKIILPIITQSPKKGALPEIRAAIDKNVIGADYYGPNGFNEMKGLPIKVQSNKLSHNIEDAKKLWKVSEKLTKIKYKF